MQRSASNTHGVLTSKGEYEAVAYAKLVSATKMEVGMFFMTRGVWKGILVHVPTISVFNNFVPRSCVTLFLICIAKLEAKGWRKTCLPLLSHTRKIAVLWL